MTTEIPASPEALARLTPAERHAFEDAAEHVAAGRKPPMGTVVTLAETIQRLITEAAPATSEAVAAERERIRQLAIRNEAVCTGDEGTACYFADLITEGPQS